MKTPTVTTALMKVSGTPSLCVSCRASLHYVQPDAGCERTAPHRHCCTDRIHFGVMLQTGSAGRDAVCLPLMGLSFLPENKGTLIPISRSTKRHWPGSEVGDRKLSSEQPLLKSSKVSTGTQKKSVSVYSLDSPRSGRLAADDVEAGESVCSHSSQVDPGIQLTNRQTSYFGNSALMESQSPPNRAELDLSLTWTKQSKSHMTFTQFHQNEDPDGDAFGIQLVSVSGLASTESQLSESNNSGFDYEGADMMNLGLYRDQSGHTQPSANGRGKRYECSICNRTYATAQNLDVHMRIHTGERPFSCEQCGKTFTQSAHLKSHLSVHSGERPYACTICSRSFIVKYSLKLHVKKCHPNVLSE